MDKWKMVPVEPTEDMIAGFLYIFIEYYLHDEINARDAFLEHYSDLLHDAPPSWIPAIDPPGKEGFYIWKLTLESRPIILDREELSDLIQRRDGYGYYCPIPE